MKSLQQYINEAKNTAPNILLDGVLDKNGRQLANLLTSIKVGNGFSNFTMDDVKKHCSTGIFKFKTKKDLEDFANTTASCEFWGAIYDYNSLTDNVDYKKVNALMKRFGNVAEGKTLYIYTYTGDVGTDSKYGREYDKEIQKNIDELKERCDKASKTFKFASYQFLA